MLRNEERGTRNEGGRAPWRSAWGWLWLAGGLLLCTLDAGAAPGPAAVVAPAPPGAQAGAVGQGGSPPGGEELDRAAVRRLAPWLAARGNPPPLRDPLLDAVGRELNRELAERWPADPSAVHQAPPLLPTDRLHQLLADHGIPDAGVLPLSCTTQPAQLAADLVRLLDQPRPGGPLRATHYGLALLRTGERVWATLLLVARRVRLEQVPRWLPVGETWVLRGWLEHDAWAARLFCTGPTGQARELPLRQAERRFVGEVELTEGQGPYRLQLLTETPRGPTVAAQFVLHAGEAPPALPVVRLLPPLPASQDPAETEQQAFQLVNQARQAAGLRPLTWQPQLARAARRHSEQMRDRGFFGHTTPDGEDPAARFARLGLAATRQAENVALAPDLAQAHAQLLDSPSHRRNILDPDLTAIGLGAAYSRGHPAMLFLTELFVQTP